MSVEDGVWKVLVVVVFILFGCVWLYSGITKWLAKNRSEFISDFTFPRSINIKLKRAYPHLTDHQIRLVLEALRDYFSICRIAGKRAVAMPSQVVDVAWHEFILFTRSYEEFCSEAFGRFLHHTPTEAMSSPTVAQQGIRRAWRLLCYKEDIDPKSPYRLPVLFAIDTDLDIPDGFKYALNCKKDKTGDYCATHIACSSGCGGNIDPLHDDGHGCSNDTGCGGSCGGD